MMQFISGYFQRCKETSLQIFLVQYAGRLKEQSYLRRKLLFSQQSICFRFLKISLIFNSLFFFLISGCGGSSLLHTGFLQLRRAGTTLCCGALASHCGGFSSCGARSLGTRASVVVARGLQSAGSVVVAHRLSCPAACGNFRTRARTRVP